MVGVPFTREEQPEVTFAQCRLADGGTMENSLALGEVEQLVLVEFTSALQFEVVAVGMSAGGIGVARLDFLIPNGAHRESPEGIALVGQQVFTDLHCHT